MNCKPGDLAVIINSVNGPNGASCGAIVQCLRVEGTHSQYGPIWNVSSNSTLVSEFGGVGNFVQVPDDWLKKLMPPPLNTKQKQLERQT